ncbi:family 2 encapsulin nanocompartment cargo protein terpene cyclase [Streptomyces sp. NPDC049967]|uniref:family 2 encapsulin nanocompartment cargo protein terpene cyclase n=1 Tax=unclassified Streptomyces TaxID=2593676 RepID=UPI002E15B922|nr:MULTISPECIES: family 2 encapsulin nanocompartment cargo protein terpene cyclase [unclassified Streptomyces]WSJ26223.1 family 2 encapsulin nanocompartment cargo protein terpene cyclase [Streptomyces sp. NBC_01324]
MPAPELPPPQSSLPEAASRFGAHVLAEAASRARDISAAAGGLPRPPVLSGAAAPAPAAPPSVIPAPPAGASPPSASVPVPSVPVPGAGTGRVLGGPTGLGTASLRMLRRDAHPAPPVATAEAGAQGGAQGKVIPGLYHHPIPEPDPLRVEEVSRRIKAWALDEVSLYPDDWEEEFDGFSVGRYMVGCHPDAPTIDHLMLATRLMVAENAVDDCYCEDHGGSPDGLGERLLLAHTALDSLHTTAEYQPQWAKSLHADAPRRAYRSAMEYFARAAGPSQADRLRHDMARLHMGYLAEAAWAQMDHVPEVWEYLAMRQFNNFRPCPTITDTVGGYELPADLHAQPAMQQVIALAGNATTIVNDLYSYTKELNAPGRHLNLPVVISEREGVSDRDAYLKSVEIHNELMHDFETAAASLAAESPVPSVQRFLRGVAAWVDGNHHWHQSNTYRYSLPDFW